MAVLHIRNVDIVTLDAAGTIVPDGMIVVRDGRIAYAGDAGDAGHAGTDPEVPDEIIDGRGRALLPGFFNGHCHSPMTFERGWAEDLPFDRWLNEKIWVAESARSRTAWPWTRTTWPCSRPGACTWPTVRSRT